MGDFDAVIIGTGAGGGAAGFALARAGKRVLFVERGIPLAEPSAGRSERRMILGKEGGDDRPLRVNGRKARLQTGGLPGGGTALYGGALLRPAEEDFTPGIFYSRQLPRELWQWPIQYEDLDPWFAQAEALLDLSVTPEEGAPYLGSPSTELHRSQVPLKPQNRQLAETLKSRGFKPFALPLAIDWGSCLHCPHCPGYLCPNGARRDSAGNLVARAVHHHQAVLWTGMEALELRTGPRGAVERVRLIDRRSLSYREVSADIFVLAAGAVGTPVLLERSGVRDGSGQLGRNYMRHLGVGLALLFKEPTGAAETWMKQLGLADFYFGTNEMPTKMGIVQQLPVPGPLSVMKQLPVPGPIARYLYRRLLFFAGTVEDLPQARNRVEARGEGARLFHQFHPFDLERGRALLAGMRRAFAPQRKPSKDHGAPGYRESQSPVEGNIGIEPGLVQESWKRFGFVAGSDRLHAAHQVGTCRMHREAAFGVVDGEGRVHGMENLFVSDGSVFPTSLGVGPALTIYAWGLRVADRILRRGSA